MAAPVSIPPTPAAEKSPDAASQKRGLAALRLELEAESDASRRGALSYELSRIHTQSGDLAAAARDALAATNYAPGFIEPLESLIGIALRRRSKGNLAKLLERLVRVSPRKEERQRAGLELFAHLIVDNEFERAAELLDRLQEDDPESATLWLARQILGSHQGDAELMQRALLGRTATARSSSYRADLLERGALRTITRGALDEGLALLRQAHEEQPTFQRLRLLEQVARDAGQPEQALAAALELKDLLARAAEDQDEAQAHEVPSLELTPSTPQAIELRIAWYAARYGDLAQAELAIQALAEATPNDALLRALEKLLLTRSGAEPGARLTRSKTRLEAALTVLPDGPQAEIELELALIALAQGDTTSAEGHFGRLRAQEPQGLLSLATQLSTQAARSDPAQAGEACAQVAAQLSGSARVGLLLAAALLVAREDPSRALRHLESARETSKQTRSLRRSLRVVAALSASAELVLAANLALVEGDTPSDALAWEAICIALATQNEGALSRALTALHQPALAPLVVRTFLPVGPQDDSAVLGPSTPDVGRALGLLRVRRLAPGTSERQSALRELFEATPSDVVVAVALAQELGGLEGARVLLRAALSSDSAELASSWGTRSALHLVRQGSPGEALQALAATTSDSSPSGPWGDAYPYLLRALGPAARPELIPWLETASESGDRAAALQLALDVLRRDPVGGRDKATRLLERSSADATNARTAADAAVVGWLQLLLHDVPEQAESEGRAEHRALRLAALLLSGDETSDLTDQARAARAWFEASHAEHGALSQDTLDAALAVSVLERKTARSAPTALWALSQALADPTLEAYAHGKRASSSADDAEQEALGDPAAAVARLAQARADSVELGWAALELQDGAPSPVRRQILEQLSQALESAEPSDPDAPTLRLLAAYDSLLQGDHEQALALLESLEATLPTDPALLRGLSLAARQLGRADQEIRALRALAEAQQDDKRAAGLWQRVGDLCRQSQPIEAEKAYAAALSRQPHRTSAFANLYRLVKARGDQARLVELIDARLEVATEASARVELLWEKARLSRALGRRASALRATELLLALDATHLRALALAAEMHLVDERFERAAESLRAIAEHPDTPTPERAQAGLHASDLLERLHRPEQAVALLDRLESLGVDRSSILERRARTAARAEAWQVAFEAFDELQASASDAELRLQAARMMLALQRDHLQQPRLLEDAARRVLADAPTDADAVDVVVHGDFSPADKQQLLLAPAESARKQVLAAPLHAGHIQRLVELSETAGISALSRLALGAAALTGNLSPARRDWLEERSPLDLNPTQAFSSEDLDTIAVDAERGTVGRVARLLSPALARLTQPSLESLGLSPLLRVDPFSGHPVRTELSRWTSLLGLGDFELYLGGDDPGRLIAFEGELPTLVVGDAISLPLGARDRARLLTSLYGVTRGFGSFLTLPAPEARVWLTALLVALGRPAVDNDPQVAERALALGQLLPRELRDQLNAECDQAVSDGEALADFPLSARSSAARLACLIHGDSSILRSLPRLIPEDTDGRRLLLTDVVTFVFSEAFEALGRKIGLE